MKRIILFPVVLVLRIIRMVVNKVAEIYAMIGIWFWALVMFGILYTAIHQQWNQTLIFIFLGVVSFVALIIAVVLETMIEGLEHFLLL